MTAESKRVLVTAGGDGIGLAIARRFQNGGARVIVTDIRREAIANAQEEGLRAIDSDVAIEKDVSRLMACIRDEIGGLDVLVNNAGIAGPTGPIESLNTSEWRSTFDVNIHGQFYCVKYGLPLLRQGTNPTIVNMSSAAGRLGMPGRSAYSASKWAVIGLTKTLAIELGSEGIRVNSICPGAVEGPRIQEVIRRKAQMLKRPLDEIEQVYKDQSSMRAMVKANDVADLAWFLAGAGASMINGQVIAVDGHTEKLH